MHLYGCAFDWADAAMSDNTVAISCHFCITCAIEAAIYMLVSQSQSVFSHTVQS